MQAVNGRIRSLSDGFQTVADSLRSKSVTEVEIREGRIIPRTQPSLQFEENVVRGLLANMVAYNSPFPTPHVHLGQLRRPRVLGSSPTDTEVQDFLIENLCRVIFIPLMGETTELKPIELGDCELNVRIAEVLPDREMGGRAIYLMLTSKNPDREAQLKRVSQALRLSLRWATSEVRLLQEETGDWSNLILNSEAGNQRNFTLFAY